jgi:multidrug efflux system membrane fusion protein
MSADRTNGQGHGQATATGAPPPLARRVEPVKAHARWPWILIVVVLAGLGFWFYRHTQANLTTTGGGGKGGRGAAGDVPVVAIESKRGDMVLYLDGLGLVQAENTVTVHTRVDGQLDQVLFNEGDLVKKNQEIAEIDPKPFQAALDTAKGQLQKDQATLVGAENDLKIYTAVSQAAMAKQQIEDQQALVNQLQGTVASDLAQVESAQVNRDYCDIKAPFDGRIGLRLVDAGNIVHAADTTGLAVITQIHPIDVVFSLAEDNLDKVRTPMASGTPMPVLALDRGLKTEIAKGTLLTIDNQIDPTTGTFKLKARFDNKEDGLFPNEFVNARIDVDTLKETIIVPSAGVQRSPASTFVYVVKSDKTVEMRPVTVAATEGDQTAISSGLAEGETVVTDGVDKLQQGTKVVVTMAKPGDQTGGQNPGSATRPGSTTRAAGTKSGHHHKDEAAGATSNPSERSSGNNSVE